MERDFSERVAERIANDEMTVTYGVRAARRIYLPRYYRADWEQIKADYVEHIAKIIIAELLIEKESE